MDTVRLISILNSVEQFFTSGDGEASQEEQQNRVQFRDPMSDHIMLLNVYKAWLAAENRKQFCRRFGVQNRTLQYVQNVYKQIIHILMEKFSLKLSADEQQSAGNTTEQNELILQCLCSGFKNNVVRKGKDDRSYEKGGIVARIHPSSGVRGGNCLLYH